MAFQVTLAPALHCDLVLLPTCPASQSVPLREASHHFPKRRLHPGMQELGLLPIPTSRLRTLAPAALLQ
eukprot:Skav213887  [mRNA]  locus=scaffold245:37895:38463:+ [translate_table: standard]